METNVKAMSIEQLKAIAYDQIALAEQCRVNIQALQAEIQRKGQPGAIPSPAPEPVAAAATPLEVQ